MKKREIMDINFLKLVKEINVQCKLIDKNSPKSGHKRNLSQYNKGHKRQAHNKHHSQRWKTKSTPSNTRNKTRMSTLATIIQHGFGSPSHRSQRRKRNTNWKRRSETVAICRRCDCIHRCKFSRGSSSWKDRVSMFPCVSQWMQL